jgi:hypothetical protein
MSAARSPLNYNSLKRHTHHGVIVNTKDRRIDPNKFKAFLLNQAEIFLEGVPKDQWIPIAMIPDNIDREVIELLDQGTIIFREHANYSQFRVLDNEDFSAFKLEPGLGVLRKEGYGI